MKAELPFAAAVGGSGVEQNSREMLINMFARVEPSARRKLVRRQRAGIETVLANTGEKRCIERNRSSHYCVIGNKFYSFDGTSLIERGTLKTSVGRCTMAFNDTDQVMVADGNFGYFWDGTNFLSVSSPVAVGHVAYLGGFGIFNKPGSGQFYITALNNFATVGALDFATAEAYSDDIVRVFVDHSEVWLFGAVSTEVWQLSGGVDFPFARFSNAQIERGISSAFSVAADDNTVFWLGDDGIFYRADGYRPVVISTDAINDIVAKLSAGARAGADAMVYTIGGNKFYTIRFKEELTLQYNMATGFWSTAKTYLKDDWQVMGSAGHYSDFILTPTAIARLKHGLSSDEGGIMERGGVSAPIEAGGNRMTLRSFFLDAEVGRGDVNTPSNVMLSIARDGETFQNERWRTLGKIGEYFRRAVWRNLGLARRFAVKIIVTDPVEFTILGTDGEISVSSG